MSRTILHLTGMISTKYGALERYFVELSKECQLAGYRTVLQYESLPQSRDYLNDLSKVRAEVVVINSNDLPSRGLFRMISLIRSKSPEIILTHFVNLYEHSWALVGSRLFGVRKILTLIHNNLHLRAHSRRRLLFNLYDHILGVSQAVSDNLMQAGVNRQKVSTHYLGLFGQPVNSPELRAQFRKELAISAESVVLGCIAFDTPFKGIDILLKSFAQVVKRNSGLHLVIIGIEPEHSTLPGYAAELGVDHLIRWPGIRDQAWRILNAVDIYIQPSRRSEGLPLAILEAMSMQLPVIATRVSGIPEAVIDGKTGRLAEAASAEKLTETIESLLATPADWSEMGTAGAGRFKQKFRGEDSIKKLIKNYFDLN